MIDTYVSIDLETTGLNPKQDKVIEIGAVKVKNGQVADRFSSFLNPGCRLERRIVELTGIEDSQLAEAPCIEEIFPALLEFVEDLPFVGHRILFDYSFLKKAAVNQKRDFQKRGIDTLKIARKYLPHIESRSLEYLCGYYEIPHRAHRALEDAEATDLLYRKLSELFYCEEDRLFCPAELCFSVKRDTPATKPQKERLYRLLAKHKIEWDRDVEKLTRSEASRFTDKILAAYGR